MLCSHNPTEIGISRSWTGMREVVVKCCSLMNGFPHVYYNRLAEKQIDVLT